METESCETLHDLYPNCAPLKPEDFAELKRKGIAVVKNKRFTAEEDKQIVKNFKRFFKDHGLQIDDETKKMALGYFSRSKNKDYLKKKRELKHFLDENKFYTRLGKGLENRLIHAIYQRARKVLSPLRITSDLTNEERRQIVKIKVNDIDKGWTEIAEIFDAHPKVVNEVVDLVIDKQGNELRKGMFDINEERCLVEAIMQETNVEDINDVLHMFIEWEEVRKHVKNRNASQCRMHWFRALRSRIDTYVKPYLLNQKPYTDLDSARLIYILYKERRKYDDVTDIDWDWIKVKFSHVGSLDIIIRWWKSLINDAPEKYQQSYFKLARWLYKKKLPSLMETTSTAFEELQQFYEKSPD